MKYNTDGSVYYTIVSPSDSSRIALFNPDGALRVVDAELDSDFGLYAPNGALRMNFSLANSLYDPSGAFTVSFLRQGSNILEAIEDYLSWDNLTEYRVSWTDSDNVDKVLVWEVN